MPRRDEIQSIYTRTVMAPHYQKALHEPDATLGWSGDPDLTLAWNRLENRYEIWREEAWYDYRTRRWETIHKIIAKAPPGDRLDVTQMIRGLVARDSQIAGQSAEKAIEDHFKAVERDEREKEYQMTQALLPVHEKLAWRVAKDTDNHKPFVSLAKTRS